jgi:hypothetical protein
MDVVYSNVFKNCYDQAVAYRSMVDHAKETRACEKQKAEDRQAQMNATKQGYGIQPHGSE